MGKRARRGRFSGAAARPPALVGEVLEAAARPAPAGAAGEGRAVEAFSFGDPEPVLAGHGWLDYIACWSAGRWYEPPIDLGGLSRAFRASPHHTSALMLKRNLLVSLFQPTRLLSRQEFAGIALDRLVLANAFVERRDNAFGRPVQLRRSPARWTRRGLEPGQFFFLVHGQPGAVGPDMEFPAGKVFQLYDGDLDQELYGVPEYLSAIQAALLSEASTLFRRKYYLNGSHMGFILYMNDAKIPEESVTAVRQALKESKGPGNFRNLFLHAPGGQKDGVQLIPVGEMGAKDEFLGVKNTTRDDILAAHRVPPQLLGIVPVNAGGFGDVEKATAVFVRNEIDPLKAAFLAINDWIGEEAVRFADYLPSSGPEAPPTGISG